MRGLHCGVCSVMAGARGLWILMFDTSRILQVFQHQITRYVDLLAGNQMVRIHRNVSASYHVHWESRARCLQVLGNGSTLDTFNHEIGKTTMSHHSSIAMILFNLPLPSSSRRFRNRPDLACFFVFLCFSHI